MKSGDRIIMLLVLIAAAAALYQMKPTNSSTRIYAEVKIDNVIQETIDLSSVSEPYTKTYYTDGGGYNVVEVRKGMIRVVEANCPEQVDVRQGWISRPSQSIVCVPHRFVITIVSERGDKSDVDGVSY